MYININCNNVKKSYSNDTSIITINSCCIRFVKNCGHKYYPLWMVYAFL